MKHPPKIGDQAELRFVVEPRYTIDLAEGRTPLVLSTPWLLWFLEHAARKVLATCIEADESCVGVDVELQHLAPTPLGQEVAATARVIHVEGKLISFQIEARDQQERIARGLHKRRIIRLDRFAKHVRAKQGGEPK